MARMKRARSAVLRLMPVLLAALVFAGMFARITMLARLSEKSKQISALEAEAARAEIRINQAELMRNELHDLDAIARRAAELGMKSPSAGQIRVIHIDPIQETPAESGHDEAEEARREGWD